MAEDSHIGNTPINPAMVPGITGGDPPVNPSVGAEGSANTEPAGAVSQQLVAELLQQLPLPDDLKIAVGSVISLILNAHQQPQRVTSSIETAENTPPSAFTVPAIAPVIAPTAPVRPAEEPVLQASESPIQGSVLSDSLVKELGKKVYNFPDNCKLKGPDNFEQWKQALFIVFRALNISSLLRDFSLVRRYFDAE